MPSQPTYDELIAEGDAVPTAGWDFSWFDGRATEERPAWGYSRLLSERLRRAHAVLDIQTGGGEVLAGALRAAGAGEPQTSEPQTSEPQTSEHRAGAASGPGDEAIGLSLIAATESWPPNVALARASLAPFGGEGAEVADDARLPFPPGSFDLVVSRHPAEIVWPEIARVLKPGGTYFSQQVGAGSNRELIDFMMGPQLVNQSRSPQVAVAEATAAGLEILDLREQALRVEFFDVAAVVHFLKKVLWTVPGFTVAGYREPLARMHEHIQASGSFVCHSERFLIEARPR
jgi:SAM-dependent methyltransferase